MLEKVFKKLSTICVMSRTWFLLFPSFLVLRLSEVSSLVASHHWQTQTLASMVWNDLVAVVLGWCLWVFLWGLILTVSHITSRAAYRVSIGLGVLVLAIQCALIHYFAVSGVALGADLFAYSLEEIQTTVRGADAPISLIEWLSWLLSIGLYLLLNHWLAHRRSARLFESTKFETKPMIGATLWVVLSLSSVMWVEKTPAIAQNKGLFFVQDVTGKLWQSAHYVQSSAQEFPFAHPETTPDTLSPLIHLQAWQPPNFIFIIVEGLGRDFSGPHARLHSFTPFLDELAGRSLYWENFLSAQGRTFAVLPSVFGSLPFASYGERAIAHDSLLSLLRQHGYAQSYFSASNLEFDHQGSYLRSEGVETLHSQDEFDQPSRKLTEWGYPDRDLFEFAAKRLSTPHTAPQLSIIQTMSMHTPFNFPEIQTYRHKVELRLDELNVPKEQRQRWLKNQDIYASILYTDDAIRRFFEQLSKTPQWSNTVVVITGDHRLPEIEMDTKLERYHVPLIVASPLIKSPQSIRSVSSHLDIAPSVLAMLAHQYQWQTPATVSWLSTGLDTEPSFRNVHVVPLKQTKASLHDYVSGLFFLNEGDLYQITESFEPAALNDAALQKRMQSELDEMIQSLSSLDHASQLTPVEGSQKMVNYIASERSLQPQSAKHEMAQLSGLVVAGTQVKWLDAQQLSVQTSFQNRSEATSDVFVPLVVISDEHGAELAEMSANARSLKTHEAESVSMVLHVSADQCKPLRCFVSVIPSHPQTGKSQGHGQYHVGW